MNIAEQGVYDLTADEYHSDPCREPSLSNSIAKLLVSRTPRHAWAEHPRLNPGYEAEHADKFDLGSAAHAFMLNDERAFAVIDADDWRTKEAKAIRDEAREAGKIPLLKEQWERVQMMVRSGRRQLEVHKEASNAFTNGAPEKTLIWKEGDVWCRARLDWMPNSGPFFDDYKTTSASADPDSWIRILYNLNFDMQAAFYKRGIQKLGLHSDPQFRFVVQELQEPFALCVMGLVPSALDLADHKVARAIEIWRTCLRSNIWPGYPDRTCYLEAPAWHEMQFLSRDERVDDAMRRMRPTQSQLKEAMEMQAP